MIQANLNETDQAILKAVAAYCKMKPGDFLRLAGLSLVDALTGLHAAMVKAPELRDQVNKLVNLRMAGTINELELASMLMELTELPKDEAWTAEA